MQDHLGLAEERLRAHAGPPVTWVEIQAAAGREKLEGIGQVEDDPVRADDDDRMVLIVQGISQLSFDRLLGASVADDEPLVRA